MRRLFLVCFLVCLSAAASPGKVNAPANAVVVNSNTAAEIKLTPNIEVLEGNYAPEQVLSRQYDSLFTGNLIENKNRTGNGRECWAKLTVTSDADRITNWILKTDKQYGEVTCYVVYPDGRVVIQKSGWSVPPAHRNIKDADVIFNLPLYPRQSAVVYLHVRTNLRWSTLDRVKATLLPLDEWQQLKWKKFAFFLFYAGICILAVFYWAITYIYSARINYVYLILTVLSTAFFYLDDFGILASLFWTGTPWWYLTKYGQTFIWLPLMLYSLSISITKLNHFKDIPRLNFFYWSMIWLTTVFYYFSPLFLSWKYWHNISFLLSFINASIGYSMLLYLWLVKGKKAVGFTVFANMPLQIGLYCFALSAFEMLPDKFALNIMGPAGALITVILIFYGMVTYVRALRQRRDREMMEKETLVREQNIMLEQKVEERTLQLVSEKKKSDDLLLNILPAEVADELKDKGTANARQFDDVTILFTDFVNFTEAGERMTPQMLVGELHTCFKAFDEITGKYNIEKIKTIGDAYLAVAGLPKGDPKHAKNVVLAAIDITAYMDHRYVTLGDKTFKVRIGVHSGNVVAGIVGVKKFAYDIWGDTVNTAARMEQNSEPGRINISQTTYDLVKDDFICTYRGEIDAKGKGQLRMYFVS
jgi:class 3 adenylate cyclase